MKHQDIISDDLVAEAIFNIAGAFSNPEFPRPVRYLLQEVPIDVYYQKKPVGKVLVTV